MTGKTSLVSCYENETFDPFPDPTIVDTKFFTKYHPEDLDKQLKLTVQDTAGDQVYLSNRLEWYEGADVFMLCFSKDQEDNSDLCVQQWINEIRDTEPRKPIVVILTKTDLEDAKFTEEKLEEIKRQENLQFVCLTSSKVDQESVVAAFD